VAPPPRSPAPVPIASQPAVADRSPAVTSPSSRGSTRILIVDDNPDNVTILRDRLQARGYSTIVAHDGEEALAVIDALSAPAVGAARDGMAGGPEPLPDLVLLDVMLPKINGFEVARRIKNNPALPFIPIIIQTALDTTADKVIGLDSGADDYITKPIDLAELEARIRSLLRIKSLQEQVERQRAELSAINDQLVRIARTDALTGIDNRRRLEERLEETFVHSVRLNEPFACVMCDLDMFKSVNDTHGHQAGDEVLRQFAQILSDHAREMDRVGRYGGEEFMLILPGATLESAVTYAERMRKAVEGRTFAFAGTTIRRTVSCGVAGWPHPGIRDADELVRAADDALYAAKAGGRNRVVRWDGAGTRGIGNGGALSGAADTDDGPADHTSHDLRADDGDHRANITIGSHAASGDGSAIGGRRQPPDQDRGAPPRA
jgi:two-component system cell cycle response regulator